MTLSMFIGNQLIDSVAIDPARPVSAGYIGILKSSLEERNEEILDLSSEDPSFFIDQIPSRMNRIPEHMLPGSFLRAPDAENSFTD